VQPEALRYKAFEPLLLLGKSRWGFLDIRLRVKGGGHVSQIYAIRQAIAKAILTYYQKNVDEQSKQQVGAGSARGRPASLAREDGAGAAAPGARVGVLGRAGDWVYAGRGRPVSPRGRRGSRGRVR
jgi:hypothetical protein